MNPSSPSRSRASSSPATLSPMSWLRRSTSLEPERGGHALDRVGGAADPVAVVGLGRQPEADEVGQDHPPPRRQRGEHRREVVRVGREAVQHEQRRSRSASRRLVADVDLVAAIEDARSRRRLVVRIPGSGARRQAVDRRIVGGSWRGASAVGQPRGGVGLVERHACRWACRRSAGTARGRRRPSPRRCCPPPRVTVTTEPLMWTLSTPRPRRAGGPARRPVAGAARSGGSR